MLKPTLMIHRITPSLFDLPLERFNLTFDDGTVDHWEFFPRFRDIPTRKIYFITTAWIGRPEFLSVDHLRQMNQYPDVEIGGHSHEHILLNQFNMAEKIQIMETDTEMMCQWFDNNLHYRPHRFCYPGNNAIYGVYTKILQKYGFTEFCGSERIDPNWLSNPDWTAQYRLW